MNNFPDMTEERRQELVADCKISISNLKEALRCAEINGWEQTAAESMSRLLRQEIALAALTAEPDHYKIDVYKGDRLIASCHPSEREGSPAEGPYRFVETAYYTAPPAPVLRVPDGWIKCSEKMPGVFDAVITSDGKSVNICLAEASAKYRYFTSILSGREVEVTHWMPLPQPPEASNEQ